MFATKPVIVAALLAVGVSSGLGVGWLIGKPEAVVRAAAPAQMAVAAPVAAVDAVAAVAGAPQPARGPVRVDAAVIESRDPIGALASQATGAPPRALPASPSSAPVAPGATSAPAAQLRPSEDRSVSWTTQPTRVERREPTLPPSAAIVPAAPVDPGVNFQRVVVVDAGSFRTGERIVRLADVSSPALDKRCTDQAGNAWPCGQRARTALESFLRNKSLTCRDTPTSNQMRCEAGGVDVAQWLLENGWAMAPNGSTPALRAIEQDARRRGAGQFTPDIRAAFDMAPASSQRPRG
jgi:endonuclease YncB( thermonuclease family)